MDRALLSENVAVCVKTIVIDSHNFELAHQKKERWPFGDFLVWYFHDAFSQVLLVMGILEDEWYVIIKSCEF